MSNPNTKTPAMVLQEFTVKHNYSPPEYVLVLSKTGTHENEFHYNVHVAHVTALGFGRSKQVAKHNAATNALKLLEDSGLYDPSTNPAQAFNPQAHRNESDDPTQPQVNYIGTLKDKCCEYKLPGPIFNEVSDVGPPHCRVFTYECKISSVKTQATANTKKQAKQLAAKDMLTKIVDICPDLAEQGEAEPNALTDDVTDVVKKFSELSASLDVYPNKAKKLDDFAYGFRNIMKDKGVKIGDFEAEFQIQNKESLQKIMEALDVTYKLQVFQEQPPIMVALFGLDFPFTVMAVGNNMEDAEVKLLRDIFKYLDTFMNVSDNSFS